MSARYSEIRLSNANPEGGKDPMAVYIWRPSGPPSAVLQIIHGMREHMGRYGEFAEFLAGQGIAVCGGDHQGHGKSRGPGEAFGHFGDEGGPRQLLKDCHRVTRLIRREYPDTPVFLLGFSMGSFIGRLYILHHARELEGFICMGTGGENPLAPYGRALAEGLIKLRGPRSEAKLLHRITFEGYNRRCTLESSEMAWLSRDPDTVRAFETDPLIHPYLTNSGFRDLLDMQMATNSRRWANLVEKSLPILLLAGKEDPVGDYGKGVLHVRDRLLAAGVTDLECLLYDGARHELLGELNKETVFRDILAWIRKRQFF